MVRRVGGVLQTIGGYGFHIYDDGGVGTSVTAFFPFARHQFIRRSFALVEGTQA
jgi:hypothetical protein